MKALIIEDEKLASDRLKGLLQNINQSIEIIEELRSVESTVEWFRVNPSPDLIFCDIELLDGQAFEIFEQVEVKSPVIFTTAYDQYAIRAFESNGIAYLLKPVKEEKLKESLTKVPSEQKDVIDSIDLKKLSDLIKQQEPHYKTRFMIKVGQKIRSISTDQIAYFFTRDKISLLVTQTGDKYPIDQSLDDLEVVLDPKSFFRVNRKFLVRFEAISEIHPYFKGRVKLNLTPHIEEDIVISSEKTPSFKNWLDQ